MMLDRLLRRDDIRALAREAGQFKKKLDAVKARIPGVAWYPYGSFTNFANLERLLTGERSRLLELAGGEPVLDIGCGDGDLSFFFESLGCRVRAIDHPATNYNGMRGVRALKTELNSAIEICAADLDSQFRLPEQRYGLALFLGTLYHLKNPYYALETIARHARWCLLSTRIARRTPDKRASIHELPVAYLLGRGEANQDWTNYWIFSEAGLKRILERTNWEVCDYIAIGNTEDSDPATWEGDERAFCLLKSRAAGALASVGLLKGWHELEYETWRWTERVFSVEARVAPDTRVLKVDLMLPDPVLERLGPVTLSATMNGVALDPETYSEAGEHAYVRMTPPLGDHALIEFELDKALPPDESDERERGIVVASVRLE